MLLNAGGLGGWHRPLNGLSTLQLLRLFNKYNIHDATVTSKDLLGKNPRDGYYIANMANSTSPSGGTHWVALKVHHGKPLLYFDSFGAPPPIAVMNLAKTNLIYSSLQIQDDDSTACGYFCLAFILYIKAHGANSFVKFLKLFSSDTTQNDKILFRMLGIGDGARP